MRTVFLQSNRGRFFVLAPLVTAALLLSSGCLDTGKPKDCGEDFDKVVDATEIHNKNEAYFDADDFAFMLDPDVKLDSVTLEGDVIPHHATRSDYSYSFNGVKCGRKDGGEILDLDCGATSATPITKTKGQDRDDDRNVDKGETRHYCSDAHTFFLNGGIGFASFLAQIHEHKGIARLMMHGRDLEVVAAHLHFKGKKYGACPTPDPKPQPPPVAPVTTISSYTPSTSPTNLTTMSVVFSADQTGVTSYCSLDGAAASVCTSPATYSALANGVHQFTVYSKNSAGLQDANPPSISWTVDTVPPTVTIDNLASLTTPTNSTSITLQFSSSESATFQCSLDGATAVACASPMTYSGLSEGAHTFSVSDVDAAGNASLNPATYQWTVDLTAPVASIVSVNPSAAINNSTTVSVQFAANESASFECSIDNGAYSACSSPMDLNNVIEGNHWFAVRATDVAGNQGLPVSYSWTTDLTAPVITLGSIVPAPGPTNGKNLSVEFSVSESATVTCSFDGGAPAACSSPFTASVTAEGPHNLVIHAVDVAGNASVDQSVSWNMDFTAPTLSFGNMTPSAATYINSADFTAEVIASENASLTATLNGDDLGAVTSPIQLLGLTEGTYALVVSGTDSVGNSSGSIEHDFVVDLTAPVVNVQAAITGLTNQDSNTITFSADESATYSCNIDGAGYQACASPLNLSGLADGLHEVDVQAIDLAGNASEVALTQWTVDTTAPTTSISGVQTGSTSINITLSSSEPNSTFQCSVDNAPLASCNSQFAISGLEAGPHLVTAYATDAAGNADTAGADYNFTFMVPVSTTITSASPSSSPSNMTTASFSFTSNHSAATFVCSLDGAAATACTSPMNYSGLANGAHTFKVQAVDEWGAQDPTGASASWTVDTVAPAITSIGITATSTSITVNWTTSKPTTTGLRWGKGAVLTNTNPEGTTYSTSHSVTLTGLSSRTTYSVAPTGTDQAGNKLPTSQFTKTTGG